MSLLGPVAHGDLRYVDVYVGRDMGIFIPSVGFCGLALRKGHTHPAFSITLFPDPGMDFLFHGAYPPGPEEYLAAAISPGVPHEEAEGGEYVSYFAVMVGPELCGKLAAEYAIPHCGAWRPFFIPKSVMPLIRTFMKETQNKSGEILLDSLETAVAATLMRCLSGADMRAGEQDAALSPGIRTAVDYIHQHYSQKLTADGLAALSAMSTGAFSRAFRRETGQSPRQFLIEVRLEKARKLLANSELSVTETALRCGFHSSSHLSSCFKQHYGVTPSAVQNSRIL